MQTLPCEAMQKVLDAARSNGCEAERVKRSWRPRDYDRDFLLMGGNARIFVRTKSHNKEGEPFATQLNAGNASWEDISHVIIVFGEDMYVLPAEFVRRRAAESGWFIFNSRLGETRAFKSPGGFQRLLKEEEPQSIWDAIQKNGQSKTLTLAALQMPHVVSPSEQLCSCSGCGKLLGRQVYSDKKLKIFCCSVNCLTIERQTRR